MKTSYFSNRSLSQPLDPRDRKLVSIALWPPRAYRGRLYPLLSPSRVMLNEDEATYREAYQKILDRLAPRKVYQELGEDAVLLCWEKPGEFCHRRLVAEWFERELGVEVLEYEKKKEPTLF